MDPTKLSSTELLARLADGSLTSLSLVKAYRAAFEADKAQAKPLNAYVEFFADAEELASKADAERAAGSRKRLLGLPIAVKDNISIRGRRLTCASNILEGYVAPYDSTVIARLKAEGALPIGRTNMDEFAMGSSCEFSRYGVSRNPFDRDRTPGGSSGGSAVAVSGGMAPLGLGSETGGSVRLPASFCGLYGYKPSYGLLSRYGLVAFGSSLDQIGLFAREPADIGLALSVAAGKDPRDSTSEDFDAGSLAKVEPLSAKGLRIAVPAELVGSGMAPGVAAALEKAIRRYEAAGAKVERVSLPIIDACTAIYYVLAPAEASSNLSRFDGVRYGARIDSGDGLAAMYDRTRGRGFGPEVKRRIVIGNFVLSAGYADAYYKKAQAVRALLVREMARLYASFDAMLCPTSLTPPFRLGEKLDDPIAMYLSDVCTSFANLAGLPAISMPAGLDESGLPVGLQLIGPRLSEARLLGLAAAWHKEGL